MTEKTAQKEVTRDVINGIFISVLIFSSGFYVPLLGFFLNLLMPMPVIFYRLKLGRKLGLLIMAAVSAVIIAATGGITIDIIFYGLLLLTGFFLGEFIEMQIPVEQTILYTCIATLAAGGICFFLYSLIKGEGIFSLVSGYIAASLNMTIKIYTDIGIPKENIEIISRSLETIQYVLVRIMPSIIAAMLMITTWANILIIRTILTKKGIRLKKLESLDKWQAKEQLVWPVIVSFLMLLVPERAIKLVGLNFVIIFMPVYFFQGIAIVSFFFQKKNFPKMVKFFIYSIIAIQQIFIPIIIGIGFFDTWIDFRKLKVINTPREQE